jgi:hypothetical protein
MRMKETPAVFNIEITCPGEIILSMRKLVIAIDFSMALLRLSGAFMRCTAHLAGQPSSLVRARE